MRPRTIKEAIEEGNTYRVVIPGWIEPYWPPAAETPEEAVQSARELGYLKPEDPVIVERILDWALGVTVVEEL